MKATVKVENLKVFAFHGCMKEEEVIGGDYVVNATAVCRELKDSFEVDLNKPRIRRDSSKMYSMARNNRLKS